MMAKFKELLNERKNAIENLDEVKLHLRNSVANLDAELDYVARGQYSKNELSEAQQSFRDDLKDVKIYEKKLKEIEKKILRSPEMKKKLGRVL